jgi:hypothetical protein
MVLDEFLKAAMVKLVGDSLERCKIPENLIEHAANALPILRNETRYAACHNHACYQNDTIKNSAYESHGHLLQ